MSGSGVVRCAELLRADRRGRLAPTHFRAPPSGVLHTALALWSAQLPIGTCVDGLRPNGSDAKGVSQKPRRRQRVFQRELRRPPSRFLSSARPGRSRALGVSLKRERTTGAVSSVSSPEASRPQRKCRSGKSLREQRQARSSPLPQPRAAAPGPLVPDVLARSQMSPGPPIADLPCSARNLWHTSFAIFDPVAMHLTKLHHVQHVLSSCLALGKNFVVATKAISSRFTLRVPLRPVKSSTCGKSGHVHITLPFFVTARS